MLGWSEGWLESGQVGVGWVRALGLRAGSGGGGGVWLVAAGVGCCLVGGYVQ
jgi:hypothetical protein